MVYSRSIVYMLYIPSPLPGHFHQWLLFTFLSESVDEKPSFIERPVKLIKTLKNSKLLNYILSI